jgi:hypothetical protein
MTRLYFSYPCRAERAQHLAPERIVEKREFDPYVGSNSTTVPCAPANITLHSHFIFQKFNGCHARMGTFTDVLAGEVCKHKGDLRAGLRVTRRLGGLSSMICRRFHHSFSPSVRHRRLWESGCETTSLLFLVGREFWTLFRDSLLVLLPILIRGVALRLCIAYCTCILQDINTHSPLIT